MPPKRSQSAPYQARHAKNSRPVLRVVLLVGGVLLALCLYMLLEAKMLRVEHDTVMTSALSPDVNQLRIVYLSDIHAGSWPFLTDGDVENLVGLINAQNPDLVLLGGDYTDDSDASIAFFKSLPPIRASYGVFGVMGNHDRTLPESNLARLRSAMIRAGVTPLVNEVATVRIGLQDVTIAGIDDMSNGWPDIAGVAAQCRQEDLVIFLSHSPSALPEALNATDMNGRKNWFDLGLCGHTHGGQIIILGELLAGHSDDGVYRSGWYTPTRSASVMVSHGAGTVGLPFRLGVPPQMHVITLKSQQ